MKKVLFTSCVVMISILACKKDPIKVVDPPPVVPVDTTHPALLSFILEATANPDQLLVDDTLDISDHRITGLIPLTVKSKTFAPTFTASDGAVVKVNGVVQESAKSTVDLGDSVVYEVFSASGTKSVYTLRVNSFTGIPILYLETENSAPIVSKDDYINGHLKLDANGQFADSVLETDLQVKGHGNTTWSMAKKPYKLKLTSKATLLGMPSSKDWILLANYSDKSLLRNTVAFELSKRFGMDYTPRSQFVELVLNGKYAGNYQLSEQVKIAKDRVNITEMDDDDNSGDAVTGGYFLEVDFRLDEEVYFTTVADKVPITFKDPEEPTPAQSNYIQGYIGDLETALNGAAFADTTTGYAQYINTSTFVDNYLVNEIMKNQDANFHSSVYLYKDRGEKISIGPVWDFDIAAGNINYNNGDKTDGWWIRNYNWYKRLFDDPGFRKKVKDRWNETKADKINTIIDFIDDRSKYLSKSQKENFATWDILNTYVWPNAAIPGSYQGEIDYLKTWLTQRIAWMDAQINDASY